MTTPFGPVLSMWEAEGNRHAAALDACAGAVVIGERPSTAAEVALGIARVQARRRRVAVADAVGELGPLEDLVPMDAPYGLVDSFFYGVSLNKIAYTVDPARNLIIFPSGAVPIDHEALLGSERWPKLLDGFRAADGLLLIVAPAESSALSSLIQAMDGVVLVGNVAAAPGTRVLAHARLPVIPARPTPTAVASVQAQQPPAAAAAPFPLPAVPPTPPPPSPPPPSAYSEASGDREEHEAREESEVHEERAEPEAHEEHGHAEHAGERALVPPWAREEAFAESVTPPPGSAKTISFWIALVAGAIIVAAILTWATTRMLSRRDDVDSFAGRRLDSAHTAARAAAATAAIPRAAVAAPAVADSAPYAVVLADVSSATGANSELDNETGRGLPAVTYAPYPRSDGSLSYVILTGASGDSAGADSLLRAIRAHHYRNAAAAHVVRLPYAVLVQRGVSLDQASMFVHAYVSKGLPVYPLVQADGSASLFAGAFRGIEQAQPLMTSFRANGDQPTVTIRTGRPF